MKKLTIACAILFVCTRTVAQKSEVLAIDTMNTKAAVLSKTLSWVARTWGTTDNVVEQQDEVAGKILIRGGLKAAPKQEGYSVKGMTLTELTVTALKGSIKLDFAHTVFKWDAGTVWNFDDNEGGDQKQKWKADVMNEITELVGNYKTGLGIK